MKKMKALLITMTAGMMIFAASAVNAATFTTPDGTLSIETPSDAWTQKSDAWFAITDGNNNISIDHLSRGEMFPAAELASDRVPATCQMTISTKNEVFLITGAASSQESLQSVVNTVGSVKILKYDTKTAVQDQSAAKPAAQGQSAAIPAPQDQSAAKPAAQEVQPKAVAPETNTAQEQETKQSAETDDRRAMTVYQEDGTAVTIYFDEENESWTDSQGMIYLPMAGALVYQPDTDTYWHGNPSYWDQYSASDMDYDSFAKSAYGMDTDSETDTNTDAGTYYGTDSMTVYREDGSWMNIFYDPSSDSWTDSHGNVYYPMAGSMVYEPSSDSYWSGDQSYWDLYDESDMDYDSFAQHTYGDNEYVDDDPGYYDQNNYEYVDDDGYVNDIDDGYVNDIEW
ncbi:MAG: hypothetical protein IKE58_09805 [Blautia sp.]|nr:hypothetical protein [Blautia sp.]